MNRRKVYVFSSISLYLFLGLGLVGSAGGQEFAIPHALEDLIDDMPESYRKELTEIYDDRQYEPLWLSQSQQLNAEGQTLLQILGATQTVKYTIYTGKTTITDAIALADIVKMKARETWYRPFVGGLGIYGPKPHRGPFVHVDVRGFPARWTQR